MGIFLIVLLSFIHLCYFSPSLAPILCMIGIFGTTLNHLGGKPIICAGSTSFLFSNMQVFCRHLSLGFSFNTIKDNVYLCLGGPFH